MATTSPITLPIQADSTHFIATLDAIARHCKALADELRQINNPDADPTTNPDDECTRCLHPLTDHNGSGCRQCDPEANAGCAFADYSRKAAR